MRRLVLLIGLWTGSTTTACVPAEDSAELLRRYLAVHASGDVRGLLAMHTEDAEFVIPGQDPLRGLEALGGLFRWDSVLHTRLEFGGVSRRGDTVYVDSIWERNDWFSALGIEEIRYQPGTRFTVEGERITGTYVSPFTEEIQQRIVDQLESLVGWISQDRPAVLEELLPAGRFRYDGQAAELWLETITAWKQTARGEEPDSLP